MRKLVLVLVAASLVSPIASFAADGHGAALANYTKDMGQKDGWGLSTWIIRPDATGNHKWLFVGGPRYTHGEDWIEVMGGTFLEQGEFSPLVDIRANLSRPSPFSLFGIFQWVPGEKEEVSVFLQGDWWAVPKKLAIGIETDNTFKSGSAEDVISWGPHLVIPTTKKLTLVPAWQFHRDSGGDQLWIRAVFNF